MVVLIVTGMSGAGKSHALRKLEDCGFFCVDNLPLAMVDELVNNFQRAAEFDKVALGIDSRNVSLAQAKMVIAGLKRRGGSVEVIFLDAEDDVLLRRYSETRRSHPLARTGLVQEGIALERTRLQDLREIASYYIDTSNLKPVQLAARIESLREVGEQRFLLTIRSFGFKRGIPHDADIVMDVRFIPNPFWVEALRPYSGKNQAVREYVMDFAQTQSFISQFSDMMKQLLPFYRQEGKHHLNVAIGCTGGRHRSVAVVESLGEMFSNGDLDLTISHRDLEAAL